jgi:hypothetical protein
MAVVNPSLQPRPKTKYQVERLENPPLDSSIENGSTPDLGFHVTATCPSCRHQTTDLFVRSSVSTGGAGLIGVVTKVAAWLLARAAEIPASWIGGPKPAIAIDAADGDAQMPVAVGLLRCKCAGVHPDGDKKVGTGLGCGSMWLLAHNRQGQAGDQLFEVPVAAQSKYWAGAETIVKAGEGAAQVVRDVATKWQGGLIALLALGAIGATLSRDTVQALSWKWQLAVGLLAALAFILNGLALFHASLAASGLPRVRKNTIQDVTSLDLAPLRQAKEGATSLVTALVSAVVAVVAGAAAIAVLVFAPAADEEPAAVKVTWTEGTTTTSQCGVLTIKNGKAQLKPSDEQQPEKGFTQDMIVAVESC